MAELRGAGDELDDGDAFARRFPADAGHGAGAAPPCHEPGPRADYADVMRQSTAEANAAQADASHVDTDHADAAQEDADQTDAPPEDAESRGAAPGDVTPGGAAPEDTDQTDAVQSTEGSIADALERFDPRRAGLPEVSREEAATYIAEHQADRPWLAPARDCSPDVQRVIVALDQGHGHAHIRHEGWVTEEMNERRVRYLEDPAQLDPEKREARIDGIRNGNQPHRCGDIATRIIDPEAFAIAFARGVEHPDVRAALNSPVPVPRPVELPISEIMGEGGHKFCSGWQLEPVDGSMLEAVANREVWLAGNRDGAEPRAQPVGTFEGGTVTYVFRPRADGGHEIITMYVDPADGQPT